jgi:uncharacterized protein involved in type VI secretion and phage assembly
VNGNRAMHELFGPPPPEGGRIYGVVVGIVTNNQDDTGQGRVKVKFPWLSDDDESNWARVATPMAGNGRGMYFLPELDDEVLVVFEQGLVHRPFVIGAVWNGKDKPPENNTDGKNNLRVLKSRSGHTILLDDTEGAEKIRIEDGKKKTCIELDANKGSISISSEGDLTVKVSGKLNLSSDGDVTIHGRTVNINDGKLKVQG